MAKRKITETEADIAVTPEEATELVESWAKTEETKPVETPVVKEPAKAPETATAPKAPKRRIRIRKKATKKLSAAIICMDPTIQRFI